MVDIDRPLLQIAEELLGEVDRERSSRNEKHFHGYNGLYVNLEKNLWYSHGDEVGGDAIELVKYIKGYDYKKAVEWLTGIDPPPPTPNPSRTLVETYNYYGPRKDLRFCVHRYSDKTFSQARFVNGEKIFNLEGVELVPYRLPELITSDPKSVVFIPGGEKDVDNVRALGLTATTNPGGEGKWDKSYNVWLRDRCVCILCDNDEMGEKHAKVLTERLSESVKELRVVRFPELPKKGDVSDWICEKQKLSLKNDDIGRELLKLYEDHDEKPYTLTCFADVESEAVDWLWESYLAHGKLTLLGGDPGQGKSNITIDIAARLSRADQMPFGAKPPKPMPTIFLCSEDGLKDTIKPRAEAAGADQSMLYAFNSVLLREGRKGKKTRFTLGSDLDVLGMAVKATGAGLVVIDAITSYMGKGDHNNTTAVRAVLDPIADWAESHKVVVLGVTHPPKAAQVNAIRQFTGSFAYVASARVGLFATKDPEGSRSVLFGVKNNLGPLPPGRGYSIGTKQVSKGIIAPYIQWDTSPVDFSADASSSKKSDGPTKLEQAVDWIKEYLSGGKKSEIQIFRAARDFGISVSTLQNAKKLAGAISVRDYTRRGDLIETDEGGVQEGNRGTVNWMLDPSEME